jgi:hypothetical protein
VPTLRTLDPRFRGFAEALLRFAREHDHRFVVTSARRSTADQRRLYQRWLKGQSALPALPPGRSQHERGLAVDMVRLNIDPQDDELLAALGQAWREAGGVWGGEVDPVHFEAPKWMTGRG